MAKTLSLRSGLILILLYFGNCANEKLVFEDVDFKETILSKVNATNIREYLKFLSKDPHLAGSVYNYGLADYISTLWKEFGFDEVKQDTYLSLLSHPDVENPNLVQLLDDNGEVIFTSKIKEDVLRPEDAHIHFPPVFNAFSPNGTVEGDVVYAHYGRAEDFTKLEEIGVDVKGKIVIARYGKIYRGNKVSLAYEHGAIGVILYSDPSEYAQDGVSPGNVYPNSAWLPGTGTQRGSITSFKGDPTTVGYPSLDGVYRTPVEDIVLPHIPCQPIGYEDAGRILDLMNGTSYPQEWVTDKSHRHRHLGPGFNSNQNSRKVRLTVNNYLDFVNITNVIGIIRGSVEPDRYVLAGNHRDAWGFGAVDASSGTAQMLEVTRVLGDLLRKGWRPRRTIVFCSWDAEESGLIGSIEWVEAHLTKLKHRAVAYINTDTCVSGDLLAIGATPFFHQLILDVTKEIPSTKNHTNLFEEWKNNNLNTAANKSRSADDEIRVNLLRGGTDHVPFAFFAGIPAISLSFKVDREAYRVPLSGYAAYHSAYDTFHLVDNYIDPGFVRHRACSHINGLLLHKLADSVILPFSLTRYSKTVVEGLQELKNMTEFELFAKKGIYTDHLERAVFSFEKATQNWQKRLEELNVTDTDSLIIRGWNDQMTGLEQNFVLASGNPLQEQYKNILISLSLHNYYGSNVFPGLRNLLTNVESYPDQKKRWNDIERHLSDILVAFQQAIEFLQPLHSI